MTHDLFGNPLPISGQIGILFCLPQSPRIAIRVESDPIQESQPAQPRRWPPPWHAATPADRRIRRQYRDDATDKMF